MIKYIVLMVLVFPSVLFAENHYIRNGATGSNNGTNWIDAYTTMPATLKRGDIYYVADGNYPAYTFDDPVAGGQYITIKKATVADHGTEMGWNNAYGDGQAVFNAPLTFTTSYWVFDGNRTHTIPSNNTNDYGFKVAANYGICGDPCPGTSGIVAFGTGTAISNVTMKYTHVYNTYNGNDGNVGAVSLRFYPTDAGKPTYIKVQNCFLENSGKDGIQISLAQYVLIERNYIKKLGLLPAGTPDVHGQTVQIFYGGDDIILRWNTWEANQGQGLVQIAGINSTTDRVRFYGNVVFVRNGGTSDTPGFNISGGILGNAWNYNALNYIISYNNTFVNIGGDYRGVASNPLVKGGSNNYLYNNLYYNCQSVGISSNWNGSDYHAAGGGDTIAGSNSQNGLSSAIFQDYVNNDFRLASATSAGLPLTTQSWWLGGSNSFFGQVDNAMDMYGKIRGADGVWDRGAYEYSGENIPPSPSKNPVPPSQIGIN